MKPACLVMLFVLFSCGQTSAQGPADRRELSVTDANGMDRDVTLARNGSARCRWGLLRIKLYDISLYLETTSSDPNWIVTSPQVKRIELHWLRDLSQANMARAYRASFKVNAKEDMDRYQERLQQLCETLPSVERGDTLAFTTVPGVGLQLSMNGQSLGLIAGDDFSAMFFTLYVGDYPPTTTVKRGLLRGGDA